MIDLTWYFLEQFDDFTTGVNEWFYTEHAALTVVSVLFNVTLTIF